MSDEDDLRRRSRALVRQATLYTWGFLLAGLLIAVGGSGLVAWLLARRGAPFRTTWIILISIVLLPTAIGLVVREVRERVRSNAQRTRDGE